MPKTRRSRRSSKPDAGALPRRSHDLYYLFAGMAHGSRKRFVRNLFWSIFIGVIVSGALAGLLYLAYQP